MKYRNLVLNGETIKTTQITKMVYAFGNPDILKSCGGYILTYRKQGDILYLGVKPAIIDGQRSNHYDLQSGPDTKIYITGSINPNGELSLLFKIPKKELSKKNKLKLKELYIQFARLLIENRYEGLGKLDWITKKIIEESKLFSPAPKSIYDLNQ